MIREIEKPEPKNYEAKEITFSMQSWKILEHSIDTINEAIRNGVEVYMPEVPWELKCPVISMKQEDEDHYKALLIGIEPIEQDTPEFTIPGYVQVSEGVWIAKKPVGEK